MACSTMYRPQRISPQCLYRLNAEGDKVDNERAPNGVMLLLTSSRLCNIKTYYEKALFGHIVICVMRYNYIIFDYVH